MASIRGTGYRIVCIALPSAVIAAVMGTAALSLFTR